MFNRRIAIFFLSVATIILLAHAVIPLGHSSGISKINMPIVADQISMIILNTSTIMMKVTIMIFAFL